MIPDVCRVCKTPVKAIFTSVLLQKYSTQYYHCSDCGYVQTGEPFWLEESYNMPINKSDTGMIMRNYWFRNVTATIIFFLFDHKRKYFDYSGGYGIFVRLMRDTGFDFYWHDKYTENLFARGFEFMDTEKNQVELLTCFEAFEHFAEPAAELENLLSISRNILLSTELIPDPPPQPDQWWYYGLEHGQHIGFFQKKTFEYLANKHSLYFYTNGQNIHLLSEKRFPAPIFKWLAKFSKIITPLLKIFMKSLTTQDSEKIKASL